MQTQALPTEDTAAAALVEAQRTIELRASQDGFDRYIKQQASTEATMGGHATSEAVKIIRGSIPLVSARITEWIDANDREGRGKRHMALAPLKRLDPDLLAFLALNSVFGSISTEHTLTRLQTHIGGQVEAELKMLMVEELRGRKVANRILDVTKRQGSSRNRSKAFAKLTAEHLTDGEREGWTQDTKIKVAEPLLNAVLLGVPDMFEVVTVGRSKHHSESVVRLSEEGVKFFADLRGSMAWMHPILRPMVVPPRPWTGMDTGCYYEDRLSRTVKLLRTFNSDHKKLVREAIADGSMDYVLKGVNAIQATAWAINKPILDLVQWCFDTGVEGVGIPRNSILPVPPKVDQALWDAMSTKERKGHRITLGGIHERNRGIVGDQAVLLRDIDTAKELLDYQSFWLPHNLDFRGRSYPVPHFNHQRADHIKALFQFANGVPLGDFGIGWLSVHLANCGDFEKVSKKTFDDRLDWVEANDFRLVEVGLNPKAYVHWWSQADKPFMFVAACMEYARWAMGGRLDTFVSHIPVALDGSNSGLQHYSAALRCETEAALVSLTPSDLPADLYQTVADKVKAQMEVEAAEGDPMAIQCLAIGVTRNLVKRNVMTFAYSSAQFGFKQQLLDDMMKPLNDLVLTGKAGCNPYAIPRVDNETKEPTGDMDGGFSAAGYLAGKVWRAVTETVTQAAAGMDFFKKVASVLAHERLPLVWTSPIGLPVMHKYSIWETKRVELCLYDRKMPVLSAKRHDKVLGDGESVLRRVQLNIRTKPSERIDKDKARSAVAPNVIHSMDGAHLLLTVLNAKEEGMTDFALIHDSFGTHAGNTQRFFEIIRESFVEMYTDYCPFEETLAYAESVLSDDGCARLPELPTKGTLDLNVVLDAPYAFA